MQTKNLTVVFTDMKGFTARTSVGSRKQVEHLIDVHDNTIRPIFGQFGGTVIKTIGDAFLATFESPTDAVLCGMKIQETVANHNATAPADDQFEVRVAINSGEVHRKADDVFGEPVNVTARIVGIAEPNEVYFTEAVYLTMNKNEIPSSEVGSRHLKGIPEQVRVYKVLQERTSLLRSRLARQDAAERSANLPKAGIAALPASAPALAPSPLPVRTKQSRVWAWVGIGAGVLVLVVAIVLFVRARREPKQLPSQLKPILENRLRGNEAAPQTPEKK